VCFAVHLTRRAGQLKVAKYEEEIRAMLMYMLPAEETDAQICEWRERTLADRLRYMVCAAVATIVVVVVVVVVVEAIGESLTMRDGMVDVMLYGFVFIELSVGAITIAVWSA
jgi:hypothetical protein